MSASLYTTVDPDPLDRAPRAAILPDPSTTSRAVQLLDRVRERVGAALNLSPETLTVDHWRFSGEDESGWSSGPEPNPLQKEAWHRFSGASHDSGDRSEATGDAERLPAIFYCRGAARGERFFAKIIFSDPYPLFTPYPPVWETRRPSGQRSRPLDEQIETEWEMTKQILARTGQQHVPVPKGKSTATKTIVWEEVTGIRLDYLLRRSRRIDDRGHQSASALRQAGTWLRRLHDASGTGEETLDVARVLDRIRDLPRSAAHSALAREAYGRVERSLCGLGQEKLAVPVALCHGDFSPANLLWDEGRQSFYIVDFEHAGYGNIGLDLASLIFGLRLQRIHPFVTQSLVQSSEGAFWEGYGAVSEPLRRFLSAVVMSRFFLEYLPRASARRRQHGWAKSVAGRIYETLFEGRLARRQFALADHR